MEYYEELHAPPPAELVGQRCPEGCQLQPPPHLPGATIWVEVLPGVILQSGARHFQGKPLDYYYLLVDLLTAPIAGGQEAYQTIVLDLTHGINYMPSTALKAVETVAPLHALAATLEEDRPVEVEVRVYNSDPIIPTRDERSRLARSPEDPCKPIGEPDPNETPNAHVHLVMRRRYRTVDLIANLTHILATLRRDQKRISPVLESNPKCKVDEDTRQELEAAVREALLILKMFRYGLIPQLTHYIVEHGKELLQQLGNARKTARTLWLEGIEAQIEEIKGKPQLNVTRCRYLTEGYEAIIHAHTITHILAKLLENTATPTLQHADKLRKTLEGTAILKTVQDREREKIEENRDKIPEKWTPLAEVLTGQTAPTRKGYNKEEQFLRDLLAHGGWHTDIIELKRQNNTITYRINENYKINNKNIWQLISEKLD